MGTAMAPDGRHLRDHRTQQNGLIIDTATEKVMGSVEVGPRPWGIAVSPNGRRCTPPTARRTTSRSSTSAPRQVTKKIPVGDGPWGSPSCSGRNYNPRSAARAAA